MDGTPVSALLSGPVLWATTGALAAVFAAILAFALRRAEPSLMRVVWPASALAVAALVAILIVERMAEGERAADRRALEQRYNQLTTEALARGSMLGCLDSAAGERVESGCEKAVFADPQSVAEAVAYVTARLALLGDGLAFARQADPDFAERLSGLRRSIELDRFGIAAHVLSSRDGCTAERCGAFALLRDTSALKANLRVGAYNEYVARHAAAWNAETPAESKERPVASAEPPVAGAGPSSPASAAGIAAADVPPSPPSPTNPVPSRFDFPSAASIPPVSIMNAEPPLPAGAASANAAAAASETQVPLPPRKPSAQPLRAPPQQILPSAQ